MHVISAKTRRQLLRQRFASWLVLPLVALAIKIILKAFCGYRCRDQKALRQAVSRSLAQVGPVPVIICANHLTLIDSMLIATFLWPTGFGRVGLPKLPWHVPERQNFGRNWWLRLGCYFGKCIFVERQGTFASRRQTYLKLRYLLTQHQVVCLFPEGGRSRTGRVAAQAPYQGVGRLLQEAPGAVVLCLYMRGDQQLTFSAWPRRGEVFSVLASVLRPEMTAGAQGRKAMTQAVIAELQRLEESYLGQSRLVLASKVAP